MMTKDELDSIFHAAQARVRVACDEYHQHTASGDCLLGDERDIAICRLAEELYDIRSKVRDLSNVLGGVDGRT
jgi:hypothetical protein